MLSDRAHICDRGCHHALDSAIITAPEARDAAIIKKLAPIVGRVLPS
jgi:5'-methylthioadenosine phosphorylase